ncbi:MAG: 50S ribosomal protein L29 [Candidatus Woykebacteria bacterium RIFCSPHIGHO2_01_FULL_39_12]|uniref:Large ribosomal subunit protein uL29 n=2 Tax=Candidatus Woykeibacteriota TaxID=1817899 RepID=A0A1G1WDH8_9BACT|nr:MAG: 50S ribosomal protein L29 [Candidatus Woykebacteria bacterium RBG_16_39_9b]OGY27158.1 MAG: 50S ribosomal protein L29 [Candidatus Woykebacteria bacterium RIFCSPHIGHO2_01_FULL_39_12]
MKKNELNDKNVMELKKLLTESREELAKIRLDHNQNKLKDPSLIRIKKHSIARILTKIKEIG